MKSLFITFAFSLLILPLILLRDSFACLPVSPLYRHMLYIFAHASIIHWLCNSWSLLVFHNLFRPSRLIVAYVLSVLVSFLPLSKLPILGLSVVVCFFLGFAGLYHIIMFIFGFLYYPVEGLLRRIGNYVNE